VRGKISKEGKVKKRHIADHRRIKLENLQKKDYIPFMGGRPKRKKVISNDDITNLSISLNTCKCLEDLLKQL